MRTPHRQPDQVVQSRRLQVTALGGLEAVIAAKKWTEVSQPFQFPQSFTSKSFTLRKMYSRLLHDYEQVYFHRNQGIPTLPPGAQPCYFQHVAFACGAHPALPMKRRLQTVRLTCSLTSWEWGAGNRSQNRCPSLPV